MKLQISNPLPPEELLGLPLHVLVRDYPELLAVFLSRGISLPEGGGVPLKEATREEAGLLEEILQALEWRLPPNPGRG